MPRPAIENLLRELAPQVLGAVVRRYDDFDAAEDAVQEALIAAARQWPADAVPDHPRSWLIQVATRRLIEMWRRDDARRHREELVTRREPDRQVAPAADTPGQDGGTHGDHDDTLRLLFLCCHPALTPPSAIALTLRAVGGLTTAEIASAFLVPETTMAQRISRAKQTIRTSGAPLAMPTRAQWRERLGEVLHVLYLIFNEGYASSAGADPVRADLTHEAVRLTRLVHRLLPDDAEVCGLLALMVLTDARRVARVGSHGELIPLDEQDRALWHAGDIAEGIALVSAALRRGALGPYQVQAAIAAVHDEAPSADQTDWRQILALYGLLERMSPNPMVTLNRAVALAMVDGPRAGLALLDSLDERLAEHHRLAAVRGHLLELAGDREAAITQLRLAAHRTRSPAEQRYLTTHIAALTAGDRDRRHR